MGIYKSDNVALYRCEVGTTKTGWCGKSTLIRVDAMGEFCVCGHCVRMVSTIAGDIMAGPASDVPLKGASERFVWRVLGGLAWEGFFNLFGLGAA